MLENAVEPRRDVLPLPWFLIGWCSLLLIFCYLPILLRMAHQWNYDDDMSHGFFVPIVAGYVAWQRRARLAAVHPEPNGWGLALMTYGAIQMLLGILGAEFFLQRSAFVVSLTGAVLFAGGWPLLRVLAFPIGLLLFMIPLPAILYNQITFPLQLFASSVAENALSLMGIPVIREGNVLELASQKLSVVEACSGIRSLLSLSFLSLVYGYLFETRRWVRVLLFLAAIPIAISVNSFRVTMTGVLSEYNPELAKGFFHSLEGWLTFIIALALLLPTHAILRYFAKLKDEAAAA